jgi:predicted nuclease of predicted toxin-antitoxin system
MRFLVDAQLPPVLAERLTALGHPSWHIGAIAALDTADRLIVDLARARGLVIISKDADFLRLAGSAPVRLLWLRIGNCSNYRLVDMLLGQLPAAITSFEAGEMLVEIR